MSNISVLDVLSYPTDYIKSRGVPKYDYIMLLNEAEELDWKSSKIVSLISFEKLVDYTDDELLNMLEEFTNKIDRMYRWQAIIFILYKRGELYLDGKVVESDNPVDIMFENIHFYNPERMKSYEVINLSNALMKRENILNYILEKENPIILPAEPILTNDVSLQ